MFRAVFTNLDLFGTPVVINFSGQEKLKTRFGFLCTLIFFGFVVWTLVNGSQEMIGHTSPKTVSSETFTDQPREMILTSGNFPFAFGLQAPVALNFENYANEKIFRIGVTYDSYDRITLENGTVIRNGTSVPINLEKCTPDHFGDLASVFNDMEFDMHYCIAQNQPYLEQLRIQGAFMSKKYETFTAQVFPCNPSTSTCEDDTEIKKYLEGAYFNMVYANMVVDPSNYTHPDARYQDVYSKSLSRTLYKITTMQLAHVAVATDNGWLGEYIDTSEYVKIGKILENSQTRDATDVTAPLLTCSFEVSKLESHFTRSYKKANTILAEVGSLANTFLMVIIILVGPYLKLRLRETLMNRLFDIDMSTDARSRIKRQTVARERAERQRYMMNRSQMIIAKQRILNKYRNDADVTLTMTPQHNNNHEEKLLRGLSTSMESIKKEKARNSVLEHAEDNTLVPTRFNSRSPLRAVSSGAGPSLFKTSSVDKQNENHSGEKSPKKESFESEFQSSPALNSSPVNQVKRNRNHRASTLFVDKEELTKIEMKVLEDPLDEDLDPDQEQERQTPNRSFESRNGPVKIQLNGKEAGESNEDNEGEKEQVTVRIQNFEEVEKEDENENQHMNTETEDRTLIDNLKKKSSTYVQLGFWEYALSYIYKTKSMKRKLQVLNAGRENIGERLDVVTILKKFRELDKIRALLFDHDQLLLFNNLPKPEISANDGKKGNMSKSFSYYVLRDTNIKDAPGTKEELLDAYRRLKYKDTKTELDVRLLRVFDEALY